MGDFAESFDYIVIGGGSAGCLLAARLSENPANQVALLEAGKEAGTPLIQIPGAAVRVVRGGGFHHVYTSEPQPALGGRPFAITQGYLLGGGSAINGMIYIRGQAADYDCWAQMGCSGWSYEEVLPVFKKLESNQRISDEFHGTDGELTVSDGRFRHPLSEALVKAATETGIRPNPDFNGARQEGVGFYQQTTRNGRRMSSDRAFLSKARGRRNFRLITEATVARIRFEGRRAVGVELIDGRSFGCRGEVIVSAGALADPKILQVSGIGAGAHLQKHGIELIADVPGVGENFQDHVQATVQGATRDPISFYGEDRPSRALLHMLRYLWDRRGLLASNLMESGGFVDTAGTGLPDIQFHVAPALTHLGNNPPPAMHGMSINPCVLRPLSRGTVKLRSPDPRDEPLFDANVLSDQSDVDTLARGVRLAMRIFEAPALKKLISHRLRPDERAERDDKALHDYIRQMATTVYHPVGTCKMGPQSDRMSVVDERLKLRGVENVRVVDASIMPTLTSGNTNAPTMMIAQRAAQFIKADAA